MRMPGLADLHEHIRTHSGCGFEICESATNLVPGEGSETADVMIVGEAPGASEDKAGRPFVGRAGKFLDQLLAEAGLERGLHRARHEVGAAARREWNQEADRAVRISGSLLRRGGRGR